MRENKGSFFCVAVCGWLGLSHNATRHSRSLAVSLPSAGMRPYPQANTAADSLAVCLSPSHHPQ